MNFKLEHIFHQYAPHTQFASTNKYNYNLEWNIKKKSFIVRIVAKRSAILISQKTWPIYTKLGIHDPWGKGIHKLYKWGGGGSWSPTRRQKTVACGQTCMPMWVLCLCVIIRKFEMVLSKYNCWLIISYASIGPHPPTLSLSAVF